MLEAAIYHQSDAETKLERAYSPAKRDTSPKVFNEQTFSPPTDRALTLTKMPSAIIPLSTTSRQTTTHRSQPINGGTLN
jgi:hypothetical protein